MVSLIILVWMSISTWILLRVLPGGSIDNIVCFAAQAVFLLAICVEAGSVETGRNSKWRPVLKAASYVAYVTYLVWSLLVRLHV